MRRAWKQYFIVYFSFFLFLLILLIPMYMVAMEVLTQSTMRQSEGVLQEGLNRLDKELQTILMVAETVYAQNDIRTLAHMNVQAAEGAALQPDLQDAYTVMRAIAYYKSAVLLLDLPSDTGIALKNGVFVASGRMHMTPEAFYGPYLQDMASDTYAQWKQAIQSHEQPYSLNAMQIKTVSGLRSSVVFAVSLPLYSNWQTYFYAVLNQQTLLNTLALPETLANGALCLRNAHGETLIDYGPANLGPHVAVQAYSSAYGLTAELRIEQSVFSRELAGYRRLLFAALAAYTLVGIVLSASYSLRNARPITRMLRAAEGVVGSDVVSSEAYKSGYDYMNAFIEHVDQTMHQNLLAIANQEMFIRENLLERLLRDNVYDPQTFDVARRYFPNFPSPCRLALLKLSGIGELSAADYSKLRISLMDMVRELTPEHSLYHFSSDLLVVLQPEGELAEMRDMYTRIRHGALKQLHIELQVGISTVFHQIEELSCVFRQLQLELRIRDHTLLTVQEECPDEAPALRVGATSHARFYEALAHIRYEDAKERLQEDLTQLRDHGIPGEADLQQMFYGYRAVLTRLIDEHGLGDIALPKYRAAASLGDTFEGILTCARALCDALQSRRQASTDQFTQAVLRAVETRLSDPGLSIQMITEQFTISGNTLQRVIRQAMGQSFYEYVREQRMVLAKHLLVETETPIAMVSQKCGYASINSFYKAFQKHYKIAPNGMRVRNG